jgi:hypothetical protein
VRPFEASQLALAILGDLNDGTLPVFTISPYV